MIISHERKFVFLHNPKAAGTTVRSALADWDSYPGRWWGFARHGLSVVDKAHMPAWLFARLYPNEFSLLEDYTVFAFVRDPLPRFVSAFNEQCKPLYLAYAQNSRLAPLYQAGLDLWARDVLAAASYRFRHRHCQSQDGLLFYRSRPLADVLIDVSLPQAGLEKLSLFDAPLAEQVSRALLHRENSKPLARKIMPRPDFVKSLSGLYSRDFQLVDQARQKGFAL